MFDALWKRPPKWKKPPKCPENQVTADDVCELLGVPREITASFFQKYIYPAAMAVCSDDEVAYLRREKIPDGILRELFGENGYGEGSFQPSLRAMMQECHAGWQMGLAAFQTKVACACVAHIVTGGAFSTQAVSANLVDDILLFDANQHSYPLPSLSRPRILIDYGPGLCGRFVVKEHLNALAKGRPYVYIPVSKGPFISAFLISFASTLMTKDSMAIYMNNGFFTPRDEGIRSATNSFIKSAPGRADVIFCSGLQMIDKQELRAGIMNAFTLLRDGGILLIRSQKTREPAESSTVDDMLEIAYEAGFSSNATHFFHSISGDVTLGKRTPTVSAILTKA